jgi:hypothetical protein
MMGRQYLSGANPKFSVDLDQRVTAEDCLGLSSVLLNQNSG